MGPIEQKRSVRKSPERLGRAGPGLRAPRPSKKEIAVRRTPSIVAVLACAALARPAVGAEPPVLEVGIATRDITPDGPIWLNGYAARNRPSERVDHPLEVTAVAFLDPSGERVVLVAFDNCEPSPAYAAKLVGEIQAAHGLPEGAAILIPSHTHSAPVLEDTLGEMFELDEAARAAVAAYSRRLREAAVAAVGAALADAAPARLEHGRATARFAINRRIYRETDVVFGENPEGPVDRDVPVLKISRPDGSPRAVLFGYACHGTSIWEPDAYVVSGDYMAYARMHIEAAFPGTKGVYLTGFGADANPSPRGLLIHAKQHGLELAGAVAGVLSRPLRPVAGPVRRAFARIDLPLAPPPSRERLQADAASPDRHVRARAKKWLARLEEGGELPRSVSCPLAVVRFGRDLTFFFLAGEVVVDYALRMKREFALENPWFVGYAFEVPCYIPTKRILIEGGYEAQSSLVYYGLYGPLLGRSEDLIVEKFRALLEATRI